MNQLTGWEGAKPGRLGGGGTVMVSCKEADWPQSNELTLCKPKAD